MQLFIELEVFDTIIKDDDIKRVRDVFGKQMQKMIDSGKMVANGFFAGKRGGYIILNVDSTEEAVKLLGIMIEYFNFKIYPVMPLDKVPELFGKYLAL